MTPLAELQATLRTAIDRREALAAKVREVRARRDVAVSRATALDAQIDTAQTALMQLHAVDSPDARAIAAAKATRDALAADAADARISASAIDARMRELEPQHAAATQEAARAAEAAAVAISNARRAIFRASVVVMAQLAREWHAAAYAASVARYASTGQPSDPVPHTGRYARLMLTATSGEEIDSILLRAGLEPSLEPRASAIPPLSERDLLNVTIDDATDARSAAQ